MSSPRRFAQRLASLTASSQAQTTKTQFFIEPLDSEASEQESEFERSLSRELSFETCSFAEVGGHSGFSSLSVSPTDSPFNFGAHPLAVCSSHESIGDSPSILPEESPSIESLRTCYNSCFSCGVSWFENHVSLDCKECGGYAMQRPCPDCDGKCNNVWLRNLTESHECRRACFVGSCGQNANNQPQRSSADKKMLQSSVSSSVFGSGVKGERSPAKSQSSSSLTSVTRTSRASFASLRVS